MTPMPRLDILGAALADPTRARMLCTLMDGRAFTNKELACDAGVTAQTATAHLARLRDAGLITTIKSGRCVYHRIAGKDVADLLEHLSALTPRDTVLRPNGHARLPREICSARCCYSHMAGRLGVDLCDALVRAGAVDVTRDQVIVDLPRLRALPGLEGGTADSAKLCLDWTERMPHLGGALGRAICDLAFAYGWIVRDAQPRVLLVTPAGTAAFAALGVGART